MVLEARSGFTIASIRAFQPDWEFLVNDLRSHLRARDPLILDVGANDGGKEPPSDFLADDSWCLT